MTTALENALILEYEKFAAENKNLTPMEQGYYDALAKLGYVMAAPGDTLQRGGYAERVKAAAGIPKGVVLPQTGRDVQPPSMVRPAPKRTGPLKPGLPGKAPAAPALGGRKSFVPGVRPSVPPRGQ